MDINLVKLSEMNKRFRDLIGYKTTCNRFIDVVDELSPGLFLVHHKSHSSYLGRVSGSVTCRSWWGIWNGKKCDETYSEKNMIIYIRGRLGKVKLGKMLRFAQRVEA